MHHVLCYSVHDCMQKTHMHSFAIKCTAVVRCCPSQALYDDLVGLTLLSSLRVSHTTWALDFSLTPSAGPLVLPGLRVSTAPGFDWVHLGVLPTSSDAHDHTPQLPASPCLAQKRCLAFHAVGVDLPIVCWLGCCWLGRC